MRLKDTSCVVTGGAMGIGKAMAVRLAAEGASVCIADINLEVAELTVREIVDAGGAAFAAHCDVTKRDAVQNAIQTTVARFGKLDVMFNNAGVAKAKPFLDVTEEDWELVMRVNGLGVLVGMQEAAKQMIAQKTPGKIINTASVAGKQGFALVSHYSASKFAVVALTQAGAREFSTYGITVNGICPGIVATELWRKLDSDMIEFGRTERVGQGMEEFSKGILLGRVSVPEDCAGIAAFLASHDSDYMTGQSIQVDGGMILQ
ncbi:meso-butanediol dehydrogenase/(S,S)-butanediol dehydrogenase/diacetyl reductase [Roseiarcus fermentans]|uniref:Meso-butanediol dehydrogenase/(S,S)-butanediol dehydrogenase/diacetyl reductase n=1 Tax=Roseiarcus fermentans TaxID=1473586 RepID=A0A366FLQ7_9HYPH|nr:glucose 1-dehydrogenase [Roseiarcus fermentans]RBP15578.1 meso-butanediol dehydrogenase/(S,S)-butanediol dehydrogenase/diacetyl reductase [Roseiarcus fermentans]